MNIFAVELPQFELALTQPLHQILRTVLSGEQDLAESHSMLCLSYDDPDRTFRLTPGHRISMSGYGTWKYLDCERLDVIPELQTTAKEYIRSSSSYCFLWLLKVLANSGLYPSVKTISDDTGCWMATWTPDETELALVCLHTLWEYGPKSPPTECDFEFSEEGGLTVHYRYVEESPEDDGLWAWVSEIVQGFFSVEEYRHPSIVSFIG